MAWSYTKTIQISLLIFFCFFIVLLQFSDEYIPALATKRVHCRLCSSIQKTSFANNIRLSFNLEYQVFLVNFCSLLSCTMLLCLEHASNKDVSVLAEEITFKL